MNKKFLVNVLYNSIGELGSRLPFIVTEIYIANFLGVYLYGIWAIIQLLVNYNNFSHFGLLSGLAKLEPVALHSASPQANTLSELRSNSFYPVLAIDLLILAILLFLSSSFLGVNNDHDMGGVVLPLFALLVVQQLFLYAQTRLQNVINFKLLSLGKLLYSVLFLLFAYLAAELFIDTPKLELLVLAWVSAYGIATVVLYLRGGLIPAPSIHLGTIKTLLSSGFPIFLVGCTKLLLISLDKLFIIGSFPPEAVGSYNISLQAMVLMAMVVGLLSRVFSPMFLGLASVDSKQSQTFYDSVKRISYMGGGVCAFFGAFIFAVVVQLYLEEFNDGVLPGILLIFSGIYQGGVQLSITSVIAKNAEKGLLCLFLVAGSLYTLVLWLSISNQFSLIGIALLNFIFWLMLELAICRHLLGENYSNLFFAATAVLIPLTAVFFVVASGSPYWVPLLVGVVVIFVLLTSAYAKVYRGVR